MNNSSIFDNVDWQSEISKEGKPNIDISDDFKPYEFRDVFKQKEEKKKFKGYTVPKECKQEENILKIIPYKTNKAKIKLNPMMEADIIPRHASSVVFSGRSGSGKSNLMVNLLTREQFYKGYFDLIFLFSPTAKSDDLAMYLKLPDKRIFTDFNSDALENIFNIQRDIIEKKGITKSPKILIIFDDIISNVKFMNSKAFKMAFIQNRHINVSTFVCTQSLKKLPKMCRDQANNIFMFPASQSEQINFVEDFCPPHTSKKVFQSLVETATRDRYNFLHINMRCAPEKRFRHNLDNYLTIKQ